jgi:signal transduction histidine kinase
MLWAMEADGPDPVERRWQAAARAAGWVAAATAYGLWVQWPRFGRDSVVMVLGDVAVGVGLVVTGLLLSGEPGQRRNGRLFTVAGFGRLTSELGLRTVGPLPTLGWLANPIPGLLLMVIILRYPQEKITDKLNRRAVQVIVTTIVVLHVINGVTWSPWYDGWPEEMWWPLVYMIGQPGRAIIFHTYWAVSAVSALVVMILVARRLTKAQGLLRRELAPVVIGAFVVGAGSFVGVALLTNIAGTLDVGPLGFYVGSLPFLLIPAAFIVASIQRRLDRAAVAEAVTSVQQPATVESVRQGLRQALADPALDVLVWLPDQQIYVDAEGRPSEPDRPGRLRRDVTDSRGGPLAAVLTDPALARRVDVVDIALHTAALSLENARLHAELMARVGELADSRARLVEAGVVARRRVERDLHDGVQQRLLALATTLGRVHSNAAGTAVEQLADQARTELRRALRELRDLARGIHPAVLEQVGLHAAIEAAAESLPVAVDLHTEIRELPRVTETTAYFVICETLANVVKHASATRVDVGIVQRADVLRIIVSDDGVGGAAVVPGGGLAGLADRVTALNGTIAVDSPAAGGTIVSVELPCG